MYHSLLFDTCSAQGSFIRATLQANTLEDITSVPTSRQPFRGPFAIWLCESSAKSFSFLRCPLRHFHRSLRRQGRPYLAMPAGSGLSPIRRNSRC